MTGLLLAALFECSVLGHYETGMPRPGNTHGTASHRFYARGATIEDAKEVVMRACRGSEYGTNGCFFLSCREVVRPSPKPLGPETEVSCADDSGLQIEVFRFATLPQYYAALSRGGKPFANFGLREWGDRRGYSADSATYTMDLDVRALRFSASGPSVYAQGPVRCLFRNR